MSEKILILHSLLSGLDILTAIILLVAVLSGLATGLVVKMGQIVAVIGSYVIAAVLASYVGLGREIVFVVASSPGFPIRPPLLCCLINCRITICLRR